MGKGHKFYQSEAREHSKFVTPPQKYRLHHLQKQNSLPLTSHNTQDMKIVCYFKISISYGNTGYIWYTVTTPSPDSLFSVGEMKTLKFTTPVIHRILPGQYCSAGRGRARSELVVETPSNGPLRTCKRGVVAIRRNSTVSTANSNLFYIAFGGLPCVDDVNIVYGEIVDGYV